LNFSHFSSDLERRLLGHAALVNAFFDIIGQSLNHIVNVLDLLVDPGEVIQVALFKLAYLLPQIYEVFFEVGGDLFQGRLIGRYLAPVAADFNEFGVDVEAVVVDSSGKVVDLVLHALPRPSNVGGLLLDLVFDVVELGPAADLLCEHSHFEEVNAVLDLVVDLLQLQKFLRVLEALVEYRLEQFANHASNLGFERHPIELLLKYNCETMNR